jgi:enolase
MKIISVTAREIYDSRGNPTIECTVGLENGAFVTSSVPSGKSRGSHEAFELRDGGIRLMGMGVQKAVRLIETTIAQELLGHEAHLIKVDALLRELDGTEKKTVLGANTMLAVSMAVCRAQALAENIQPYELMAYLCEFEMVSLAYPMFNMINGGAHANNDLQIQEYLVIPVGMSTFHETMEAGSNFFHILKRLLDEKGYSTAVGDEGGFAPDLDSDQQALDLIMETIEFMQHEYGISIMIALDVAATQFYDRKLQLYKWQGDLVTSDELIKWYQYLAQNYPLYAIEDGLSEDDWEGWGTLYQALGNRIAIVGDDIFATNSQRIYQGIEEHVANTVIIKPNQVGTLTETLQAVKLCKAYEKNIIVSHRSGETNDSFIADLAVAASAGQIKAGGFSRGERLAKYNRLLKIEDDLLGYLTENE